MSKLITGRVRFSYVKVFKAEAINEGGTKKFSVSIIVPKSDEKAIAAIKAKIEEALTSGLALFNNKRPATFKNPLRDGDLEHPNDEAYADAMFFNANSTRKPGIVDGDRLEIVENPGEFAEDGVSSEEFYSGCYGRASINFYPFNVSGNRGVAAGLQNLQKLDDGTPLGGSITSAADDFADDADDDLM